MTEMRMYLHSPRVVFRARVNMASVTYPVNSIAFDNVTIGAYTDIKDNMTVRLGSGPGLDDLGRTRIREGGVDSSHIGTGLCAEGTRDGELTVDDNAYIDVLDDYRVWAMPPRIESDGTVLKDGAREYSTGNWNDYPNPVPITRPGVAGTIDSSTGVLTVQFSAADSYVFDTVFTSVSSYSWDVADGTITAGTSTSAAITATFPAGFRWVILRVGYTSPVQRYAYRYIPIFARDPNNDASIVNFQMTSHIIRPQGQEISLRIYQNIARANYPDGTLMMLWDQEPPTTASSRNMLFIGWHHADDVSFQSDERALLHDTTLHFLDVAGKLRTLPGFPQLIRYAGSPSSWEETSIPSLLFYPWYLLYWHSTAIQLGGLRTRSTTPSLNLYPFYELGSDADNLYGQVNGLANKVTPDFHLNCTRQGELVLAVDPIIQDVSTRASTIRDVYSAADVVDVRYVYTRPPRVYQLRTYAVIGNTSGPTAIACVAPGDAPGQGEQYTETSARYAASQFGLNACEGNRYARANARYGWFTLIMPYERLAPTHDIAYLEWAELDVSSVLVPRRGALPANARGLTQEVSIQYQYSAQGLVRTATVQWEMETSGPPAVTMELEE